MKINKCGKRGLGIFSIASVVMGMSVSSAQSSDYPNATLIEPSLQPIFPAEFSPFSPPVTTVILDAQAPDVAEWTRSNGPGDTLVLTGSRLSAFTGDAEGRDTRFVFFGQSGLSLVEADGLMQRLDGMQVAVTLPNSLPENETYLMWPRNDNGYGSPIAINRTEMWWIGPDTVSKGEAFSVYGRDLKLGVGKSYLYIEELDRWLTSSSENPYKADFILPADVGAGTYTVWAHNGSGLQYGWSKPLEIVVADPVVWDGPTINVVDYGAKGDGVSDDFSSIKAAIDAAAGMDHPTVYFPAGTYLLSGSIHNAKYDMRLMGAGMNQTAISTHPTYGNNISAAYGLFYSRNQTGPVEFWDMTLSSGAHLEASLIGPTLAYANNGARGSYVNVRFSQLDHPDHTSHSPIVELGQSSYMTFRNCEFILAGAVDVNEGSRQIIFDGCTFWGINDVNFMINVGASRECSVTHCLAMNYDNSDSTDGHGWAQGRFLYGSGRKGRVGEIYYGDNATSNLTVRETYTAEQNTGEQFMTEFGRTLVRANPTSANLTSVTFPSLTEDYADKIIAIVGGVGIGQNRLITSTSGNTVTMEHPWRVAPDSNSVVMIGNFARRHVVYDSLFDGVERAVISDVPSTAGVMPYGSQFEMVVDSNYFHQLKHGISLWGIQNEVNGEILCRPLYFNLFANNTLDRCRRAIDNSIATYSGTPTYWDINLLGNVFRGNSISNTTEYAFRNRTWDDSHSIAMCIYDQNTSIDCKTNIGDDMGLRNQIWVGNKFTSFNGGTGIKISSDHIPSLHQNTWEGFSSTYGGALPGAVLELPTRVISLEGDCLTAEVAVRNSGTDALNWTATTDCSWLNITKLNGTIADESSADTLLFEVDTDKIPEGETEAVITVSAAGQDQQMTVELASLSLPPPPPPPPAPVLTELVISGPASLDEGTTAKYICTASYSDGTTSEVTAIWTENASATSISTAGMLTAGAVSADQSATLTASFDGMSDTYAVTIIYVPPVLTGIVISGSGNLDEKTSAQYSCTANYSDGTSLVITPVWSENSIYASINGSGVLSTVDVASDQSLVIAASFGGKSDTHSVTIKYVPPVLTSIAVSGATSLNEGATAQYVCTVSYSDSTSETVVPSWSENSSSTTISSSGLLSAGNVTSDQNVIITASFGGETDTHIVVVKYVAPTLVGIEISGVMILDEETTAQYVCTANYSDGTSAVVIPVWSENSAFASIGSSGVLAAGNVTAGQGVTITAIHGGKSDTHFVTINYIAPLVVVTSLVIAGPDSIEENTTAQYICTAHYSDGTSAEVSPAWSASSTFASIATSGLLSAANVAADENATITASFDGQVDTHALAIMVIGDQVVFPLDGFTGKTVSAELWDDASQATIFLGEEFEPEEIVIENVNSNQWYWLGLREYNVADDEWALVHGRWIWM